MRNAVTYRLYALALQQLGTGLQDLARCGDTRAEAEDACALIEIDYEPLAAVTDAETALDPATPVFAPLSSLSSLALRVAARKHERVEFRARGPRRDG